MDGTGFADTAKCRQAIQRPHRPKLGRRLKGERDQQLLSLHDLAPTLQLLLLDISRARMEDPRLKRAIMHEAERHRAAIDAEPVMPLSDRCRGKRIAIKPTTYKMLIGPQHRQKNRFATSLLWILVNCRSQISGQDEKPAHSEFADIIWVDECRALVATIPE